MTLRKLVHAKKVELDQPRPIRPVRSERIRSRRSVGGTKAVAEIAALAEPEEVTKPNVCTALLFDFCYLLLSC